MVLAVILIIIMLQIVLIWKSKNLYLIEILTIWLFISTLNQNILDIMISNLELLEITKSQQMFWSSFFNRYLLIPLLVILFVNFYSISKSTINKIFLFFISLLLLTTIDQLVMWVGILKYHRWVTWWSIIGWLCILLATLGCRKILHYLLLKGNEVT